MKDGDLWEGKYKIRKNYDTGGYEASIGGIWTMLETVYEHTFDYEEGDKLCDHMYVWLNNVEEGQRFQCHECGDCKVM